MISQYCRLYHQTKPFSHIVIDLFKEVSEKLNVKQPNPNYDEHKSDTDSGRSSIHCEKELIGKCEETQISKATNQLRVTRCTDSKMKALHQLKVKSANIFAYEKEPSINENEIKQIEQPPMGKCLQVINRKNAILKRRNLQRRNTIDVSQFKLDKEINRLNEKCNGNMNASKSINCLNKMESYKNDEFLDRINRMNFVGSSMPGTETLYHFNF